MSVADDRKSFAVISISRRSRIDVKFPARQITSFFNGDSANAALRAVEYGRRGIRARQSVILELRDCDNLRGVICNRDVRNVGVERQDTAVVAQDVCQNKSARVGDVRVALVIEMNHHESTRANLSQTRSRLAFVGDFSAVDRGNRRVIVELDVGVSDAAE